MYNVHVWLEAIYRCRFLANSGGLIMNSPFMTYNDLGELVKLFWLSCRFSALASWKLEYQGPWAVHCGRVELSFTL